MTTTVCAEQANDAAVDAAGQLDQLATLVATGELTAARRAARALLDHAPSHELDVMTECLRLRSDFPQSDALAQLKQLWRTSNRDDRAIIERCAPKPGSPTTSEPDACADRPSRWTPEAIDQARREAMMSSPAQTRTDAAARRPQRPAPRPSDVRAAREVNAYDNTRAGVDDQPTRTDRPDGYTLDYDRSAVRIFASLPCVYCWIERGVNEVDAGRVRRGHGDDGLCESCRGRQSGIPELPPGHSAAEATEARCAYIAAHTGRFALPILRHEHARARSGDTQATIKQWVTDNRDHITPEPDLTVGCQKCSTDRSPRDLRGVAVNDGLCAACRKQD